MKAFVSATALLAVLSGTAMACTQDELVAKIQTLNTKIQALAAKDPQKATTWAQKVSANTKPAQSIDEACTLYDGWIVDIDKQ